MARLAAAAALSAVAAGSALAETPVALAGPRLRVVVSGTGGADLREQVQILDGSTWTDALDTTGSVVRTQGTDGLAPACTTTHAQAEAGRILLRGKCGAGFYER
ncbi:MAG TPA: hypothetical protein VMV21_13000, partial [Vicinamibacteria bacterium]|nr:hypothetical protein [Vicinamibacteria bacterium]